MMVWKIFAYPDFSSYYCLNVSFQPLSSSFLLSFLSFFFCSSILPFLLNPPQASFLFLSYLPYFPYFFLYIFLPILSFVVYFLPFLPCLLSIFSTMASLLHFSHFCS
ncbi:hypothetical protein ATANTOWER_027646 [Ataeniobius toweri]|uniref:Uncharacterized protein n=1 Tax=Ataeniobius toweri TaxID=208326 RepID=A0ABU7B3G2_9TELE|nr:hypothetical protein [Ataeniobius toweri]